MQHHNLAMALEEIRTPIMAVLKQANKELALRDASSIRALALVRWELMRHLRAYQLYKHSRIFDPIIGSGIGAKTIFAQELKDRCLALARDYETHVTKWSLTGPAAAWSDYVSEAQAMSKRIERHLFQETQQIEALLSGSIRNAPPARP